MPAHRRRRGSKKPKQINISAKTVDLLKVKNSEANFTSDYECKELVVRRGFSFKLLVTLSRALNKDEKPEFELRAGGRPMKKYGSLIPLPMVDPKVGEDVEGVKIIASNGSLMEIEVFTSGKTTGVGKWLLTMRVRRGSSSRRSRRRSSAMLCAITHEIIIVFNPWCKHDPVYMEDESWRDEYVLNEEGLQYYGSRYHVGGMDWYYGQFEPIVMKAVLKLLTMLKPGYKDRNDPVMVARNMSAFINSQDDNGVLEGNWSGEYSGGLSPTTWNGSVAILKKFVETNEPVKYGQCWVFSGVSTTVMRCLGIPARSLTNFESAHDTDGNLTIDYHYDSKNKPKENDDSVWNFHVWNDVWMARDDLNLPGFGGWQALDATPQETSEGRFQCGPASVQAIKQGRIDLGYDGKFIYAEVNATKQHWKENNKKEAGDPEWIALDAEDDVIGCKISTKAIGCFNRNDITHEYKYKEGSTEERSSFDVARKFVTFTHAKQNEFVKELRFKIDAATTVEYGSDLTCKIKVINLSEKDDKVVHMSCITKNMQYNGSLIAKIDDQDMKAEIAKNFGEHEFEVTVEANEYIRTRGNTSASNLKLSFLFGVDGSNEAYARQILVNFIKPTIDVEVIGEARIGCPLQVNLSFTNPLSTIICGHFLLEGAGIREAVEVDSGEIAANGKCTKQVEIKPKKRGQRRLIVGFESSNLTGVQGRVDLNVV